MIKKKAYISAGVLSCSILVALNFFTSKAVDSQCFNLMKVADFDSAMTEWARYNDKPIPYKERIFYDKQWPKEDFLWRKAKELYNEHIINNPRYSSELYIPKIIHQIWLGSPYPERCKKLRDSWLKNNPEWEYILWTEKEIKALGLVNQDLFDRAKNYGEKSDIARYEILYRFGGLYIDTDFECLRSFDIIHQLCDFYLSIAWCGREFSILNGLIGCKKEHPILKYVVNALKCQHNRSNGIMERTGPYFLTRCLKELFVAGESNLGRVVLFPASFFCPLPCTHKNGSREEIEQWIKPESFSVHYWHCSWM